MRAFFFFFLKERERERETERETERDRERQRETERETIDAKFLHIDLINNKYQLPSKHLPTQCRQ